MIHEARAGQRLTARFTIVVPAYNAESTITETLDAVRAQQYDDWECIVVDDGSTDATNSIAQRYVAADPRFTVIAQENSGTGGAYNAGVAAARGEFIVLCSADDQLLPEHLTTMSAFIETHGDFDIFSSNGVNQLCIHIIH
ncbi:glycosyltransferase family 2 protein, partial [bacterium]|nr:glycosyltransferase family 2 protein [bacterium]